jgi:hypothetical protein
MIDVFATYVAKPGIAMIIYGETLPIFLGFLVQC